MKAIFLDLDGVLNTEIFVSCYWHICKSAGYIKKEAKELRQFLMRDEFGNLFDPMTIRCLKYIIEETGAKIIISSTWRASGLKVMQLMWEMRDIPGEVIDITPFLNTERGEEIAEWLRNNEVESYVIIDDDSDMLPEQMASFVKTDFRYGLTWNDAEKCIQILNKSTLVK